MGAYMKEQQNIQCVSMDELADILGIKQATLRKKWNQSPQAYPPVIDATLRKKRFLKEDVMEWLKGKRQ